MKWSQLAKAYADAITAAERPIGDGKKVKAYHDPQRAMSNRPCVLIGLPTVAGIPTLADGGLQILTWEFLALASKDTGALSTLHELEDLVSAVASVFDVETARPATYKPSKDASVPCYVLTVTDPGEPS